MSMKFKHLMVAGVVLALAVPLAIAILKKRAPTNPRALIVQVERGSIRAEFFSSGTLAYRHQARLSSELVAKVIAIHVQEGDSVVPGQELIKLDDSTVRAEIAQFEAQLARSKIDVRRLERELESKYTEWQRQGELAAKGMISKQAADASHVAFDSARFLLEAGQKGAIQDAAQLTMRQKLMEKTVIRSPIRGVVINIPIKVGETAVASAQSMAGSSLMDVADPDSMLVEAAIAEFDIGRIRLGQRAIMTTRAAPNRAFPGKVVRIARSMSQSNGRPDPDNKNVRTVPVQVELETIDPAFIAGMSSELSFLEAGQDSALVVPIAAVQVQEDHPLRSMETLANGARRVYFVWQLVEGRAIRRNVELSVSDEHRQEVRQGLKFGDHIVAGPASLLASLKEGDRVDVLVSPRGK
jgi:HlyD family secretion protein